MNRHTSIKNPGSPALAVQLAPTHPDGLALQNPVMTASGTAGYGPELARVFDLGQLGALVAKTVTPGPRTGNPTPRTVETPSGMLNSIGLPNPGIHDLLRDEARAWPSLGVPIIASLAADSAAEFRNLAAAFEGLPGVVALEANFSCPNVEHGMEFATDPGLIAGAVESILEVSSLPLLAKLSPNVTDMRPIAVAAAKAGAHALTIMNTVLGMKIDVRRRRPLLGDTRGGLSGPAIRPVGVRFVHDVYPEVDIPIIGVGGIATLEDALEYILAGATAVQVGTATFVQPDATPNLVDRLAAYLEAEGLKSLAELTGAAHRA
ncbi:MAG: dihydroorotate dehydrogenase [Chloroflexota bacterium]|nr:dihydroorotate dehydrogenase [Chloroflexota bacterium]